MLLLILTVASYAQKATIEKVWIDHGQTRNGEKGMLIHVKFSVDNAKGHAICVQARIQRPRGTYLKSTNSNYKSSPNGWALSKGHGTATYENTIWNDFKLWMPISAFHMENGKNTYYVRIDIYDSAINKHISVAPGYCSFTGTGSVNANHIDGSQSNPNKNGSGVYKGHNVGDTWREQSSDGKGYTEYHLKNHAECEVRSYSECFACTSRPGICTSCNGTGMFIAYFVVTKCSWCNGTGKCPFCRGSALISTSYTLYLQNGKLVAPWGSGASGAGGYNAGGSNSSGGSSSAYSTCRICNGSGRCTSCRGTGTGMYTYGGTSTSTCSSCNGSGKCFNCYGTGRQ